MLEVEALRCSLPSTPVLRCVYVRFWRGARVGIVDGPCFSGFMVYGWRET